MLGEGQNTRHRRWEPKSLGMAIVSFSTSPVDALKMFKVERTQAAGGGQRTQAHLREAGGDTEVSNRPVPVKGNSPGPLLPEGRTHRGVLEVIAECKP